MLINFVFYQFDYSCITFAGIGNLQFSLMSGWNSHFPPSDFSNHSAVNWCWILSIHHHYHNYTTSLPIIYGLIYFYKYERETPFSVQQSLIFSTSYSLVHWNQNLIVQINWFFYVFYCPRNWIGQFTRVNANVWLMCCLIFLQIQQGLY